MASVFVAQIIPLAGTFVCYINGSLSTADKNAPQFLSRWMNKTRQEERAMHFDILSC